MEAIIFLKLVPKWTFSYTTFFYIILLAHLEPSQK